MSLLRFHTMIDERTGERVRDRTDPNERAVECESWVFSPGPPCEHDDLTTSAPLTIITDIDLGPFRLWRERSIDEDEPDDVFTARDEFEDFSYTLDELKAAVAHPDVTRERVVEGIGPPERGRRVALYDAIAGWIKHVENKAVDAGCG